MSYERAVSLLDAFRCKRIAVLGDVMLDRFIYGAVDRISPEAPVPILSMDRTVDMPGGAANVARNIVALGGQCDLLGVVGSDEEAIHLRQEIERSAGVRDLLVVDDSRPTTLKIRYIADGQQIMRADRESRSELDVFLEAKLLERFRSVLTSVDLVILSDYAKGVLSTRVLRGALQAATELGKPVIVDPKNADWSRYAGATLLTPNRLELSSSCRTECLTNEEIASAARGVIAAGICQSLVVTRGKDGMSVVESAKPVCHLATDARQVFDVSGAGDTVIATLALGVAADASLTDAADLANAAAGIVVGKQGTSTVTSFEILSTMRPSVGPQWPETCSLEGVIRRVQHWRNEGLTVAFTNGCFDLLHPGHIALLEHAKRSADRLVVALNNDQSVRRLKGATRPIQGEVARATVLASLKLVDAVVLFAEDTPLSVIEALNPDVLVKGADYSVATVVGAEHVVRRGGRVVLAPLLLGHSTSATVTRVAQPLSA